MGCVRTISYDKFPEQNDIYHEYPELGKRVKIYYHYDTSKYHYGTIVRSDAEAPYHTIIKTDNGRYMLGSECQYSIIEVDNEKPKS